MSPSAPLLLLSSMATRELLKELAARYARSGGVRVEAKAAGGVDVARRVRTGEVLDVVVLAGNVIDELLAEGHLVGERVDLVRSGVGIAVPAGRPRPDVGSEAAVREAVRAAPTIGFSTGPSGVYLQKLFERWGILAQVKDRIVIPPPGVPVGSLVAEGKAALGFQQLSELINVTGIEVLGPLPAQIQQMTVFAGGVARTSANAASARSLLASMSASNAAEVKRLYGMEPMA